MTKRVASIETYAQSQSGISPLVTVAGIFESNQKRNGNGMVMGAETYEIETLAETQDHCDPALDMELLVAAQYGDLNRVKRLLNLGADAKASNSQPLRIAASNGHVGCVEVLLDHSDVDANESEALLRAAQHGYPKIVALLLSPDTKASVKKKALKFAQESKSVSRGSFAARVPTPLNGHQGCIDMLVP